MACAVPNCIFGEGEAKIQLREGDMAKFDPSQRLPVGSSVCLKHYGTSPDSGLSRTVLKNYFKDAPHHLPTTYTLDPLHWNGSKREQTMHKRRLRRIQMGVW